MVARKRAPVEDSPEILRPDEVARRLRTSTESVRRMIRRDELPVAPVLVGRRWVVRTRDLDAFLGGPAA